MQNIEMNGPYAARSNRISDLIPENGEGSIEKVEFRNYMAALYFWMQSVVSPRRSMLVRVQSVNDIDSVSLSA